MRALQVMVVGTGARGTSLAKAWAKVEGARVVCVCDPDQERAKSLASEVGAADIASDYRQAIPGNDVDVVVNATPAFLHLPVTKLAAAHGKHVLSEKPIALNLEQADETIEVVEQAGVCYAVCHQLRHSPVFGKTKELIQTGAIGRPLQFRSNYLMQIRPKILMHSKAGNGGPVIDFVCHRFDYQRNLLDSDPAVVYARGFTIADDKPELASIKDFALDTVSFVVEYASGDIWSCNICWGVPPGVTRPGYEDIVGRDGVLTNTMQAITITGRDGAQQTYEDLGADLDYLVACDLAKCVREGGEPVVTGRAAREALRGSLAVLESCETDVPVRW